ncbi:uncharacterized protein BDR25DRAFT_292080 [Lindgomyces ingoldianus]|uniref:Uncharacterized protein n=1 Tax=Lindgomyces ingoldianus TaxID=673940 RepID=A0ACB6QMN8_9PLEO|nr:uncharacterized protein BDR25DRAFT_292080 [Lindgomyces ingoldianus]KAF2467577.1 hypothetical protein BDR25DRAFT_292080 [Lindgomyces ingoldianus]
MSIHPQSSSTSKRSHLHGLHHHPHRHHHHHSRHGKDTVQSAIQLHPPTSFGDLLKQASRTSHHSLAQSVPESRRVSVLRADAKPRPHPLKPVPPEDVARERARVKARENELSSSLQTLSDQSLKASRQLDDTYYSVLEKVAILRQTIGSLQELSGLTKELHENFQADTKELTEEVKVQFDGFNNFGTQQGHVEALEERIRAGKGKASALHERLVEARSRVDARAKLEAKWEARTTRRLRILWGIFGTLIGLVVIAMLVQQLKPVHSAIDSKKALDFGSRSNHIDAPIPESAKEALINSSPTGSKCQSSASLSKTILVPEADPGLRTFDEL